MIQFKKLSKKDKYALAEYIYSYESDILIKSDAEAVLKVLANHGVEKAVGHELEAHSIMHLIKGAIEREDRTEIMNEYYSGKL